MKCPKCEEEFADYYGTIRHYELRHDETPCPQCGELVNRKCLKRHISFKHTAIEDRNLKCQFCPKGQFL